MKKYIAILRGINVGGKRKILMADLQQLLNKNGFKNCSTYIQSGNVLFLSDKTVLEIEKEIKQTIFKKYGFDVPVLVRTVNEIENVFHNNPFLPEQADINKLYVAFLAEIPSDENLEKLNAIHFDNANFEIHGKHVFMQYYTKSSDSKLTNNLIENKLKVTATSRNWKTVTKLFELSTT
ncbi:DUF1697 domain-containing protein [Aureibaculum sp. A20]|uniref:DUF1697 domain-containing protein n=1 Tax=Aureibaculum flavum TaxID=2795986 RepID=A0ABS0WP16_9FLAO|nr:DUF1697 domain-containing protein [Aureibaculum flavum]MBJ2173707.1 DUF1697 domain-containing protein [Aureibaculum flavum]